MDMVYSAPVHVDALLLLEIIDDAWAAEKLPVEDIVVPPSEMVNLDDDDPPTAPDDDDDKWNDLGLDELAASTFAAEPPSDSDSAHPVAQAQAPSPSPTTPAHSTPGAR